MKKRQMYIRMITASLLRRRSRMLIALLAIAIGAAILSGLVTIYTDVPRQLSLQFRNYGANMILTAQEGQLTQEDVDSAVALIPSDKLSDCFIQFPSFDSAHEQYPSMSPVGVLVRLHIHTRPSS